MRIVVDAMGGDHGPGVVVEGVRLALLAVPGISWNVLDFIGFDWNLRFLLNPHILIKPHRAKPLSSILISYVPFLYINIYMKYG